MGYRSDIAYAIVFENPQERDAFLADQPADDLKALTDDGLRIHGNGIYFQRDGMKWYDSIQVTRHEHLLAAARDAEYDPDSPRLVGAFVRIGEEPSDIEQDRFGDGGDGLPQPWELVEPVIMIDYGPAWPQD